MRRFSRYVLSFAAALAFAGAPIVHAQEADEDEIRRLEEEAEEVGKLVERIRGLKFNAAVKKGIQSKDELRKFVMEELEKEMPPEKTRALEKAYVKLGFLKRGQDLKKILVDLYSEQIAGFYNPERKELFLIAHGGPEQPMLMAHELTHAIQDQNFDLLPLQKSIVDNDDRALALTSVIEGDATVVMVAYMLQAQGIPLDIGSLPDVGTLMGMQAKMGEMMGGPGSGVLKTAPKFLTENLMFGYVQGASFCQRLIKNNRRKGFQAISETFADLPTSSEQILHPEKFTATERDLPVDVTLPDLAAELGAGWKLLVKNVMGEFNTSLLFREQLDERAAERAAAGWGGDAWQVLEGPKGEVVLAWLSEWDTEKDAEEFARTYREFAAKRGDGSRLELARDGKRVTIVDGFRDDFSVVEKLRSAFGKVEGKRGYAPAALAAKGPFEGLKLPEGWREGRPGDAAVRRAAAGPGGVELAIVESEAAHRTAAAAAKAAHGGLEERLREVGGGFKAGLETRPEKTGWTGAYVYGSAADRAYAQFIDVIEGKQHVLSLEGPPSAVNAALRELAGMNPERKWLAPFAIAGGQTAPARPRRDREPKLF